MQTDTSARRSSYNALPVRGVSRLPSQDEIPYKEENRQRQNLQESDFLLGVFDESRMGALRMKLSPDGEFLDNDPEYSTPPFASLRELEHAAWQLENDDDKNVSKWLKILIAPGSSLGGARPKANVTDTSGNLWIAKFPSRNDRKNVGAWEAVTMSLAKQDRKSVV